MKITVLLIRLVELLIGSIIMSSVVCFFCDQGIIPTEGLLRDGTLTALPIIYILWNVYSLRRCYVVLGGEKSYYIINAIATVVFVAASLFAYKFYRGEIYSWFFLTTGLGSFLNISVSGIKSILAFHCLLSASIFLAPIGLGWVKMAIEEEEELMEVAPGFLEVNPLEPKKEDTSSNENQTPDK